MIKTLRKLNESRNVIKSNLNEQVETTNTQDTSDQKTDVTVVNDVEVNLISGDNSDMKLSNEQQTAISQIIDLFRQQVSQVTEFDPGFTLTPDQIRLDGTITDPEIKFVLVAGKEMGLYVISDMMLVDEKVLDTMTKLSKFWTSFRDSMEPLITERNNNI